MKQNNAKRPPNEWTESENRRIVFSRGRRETRTGSKFEFVEAWGERSKSDMSVAVRAGKRRRITLLIWSAQLEFMPASFSK